MGMRDLQVTRCIFMNEDNNPGSQYRNDLPGSLTTRTNKPEMVECLIEDYFKKRRIVFHRDFIVAEPEYSTVNDVQGEFVRQLRNFCCKRKECRARDGSTYFEKFYLGKIGGGNDDFVLALLIGVYMHRQFFSNRKYSLYWR